MSEMHSHESSIDTTDYDLSRMRDRARDLMLRVESLALTKVNGELDDELRRAAEAASGELALLARLYEDRLGDPAHYVEEAARPPQAKDDEVSDLAKFQEGLTRALNRHGVPAMPSWDAAIDWLAEYGDSASAIARVLAIDCPDCGAPAGHPCNAPAEGVAAVEVCGGRADAVGVVGEEVE